MQPHPRLPVSPRHVSVIGSAEVICLFLFEHRAVALAVFRVVFTLLRALRGNRLVLSAVKPEARAIAEQFAANGARAVDVARSLVG